MREETRRPPRPEAARMTPRTKSREGSPAERERAREVTRPLQARALKAPETSTRPRVTGCPSCGPGSPCLAPGHRYQQGPCAGADNVTERQAEGLRHPTPHPLCPMTRVWGDTGLRSLGPNRVCSTRLTATVRNPQAPVPPAPPATLAPSRQQPAAKPGRVLARPHLADAAARGVNSKWPSPQAQPSVEKPLDVVTVRTDRPPDPD